MNLMVSLVVVNLVFGFRMKFKLGRGELKSVDSKGKGNEFKKTL